MAWDNPTSNAPAIDLGRFDLGCTGPVRSPI